MADRVFGEKNEVHFHLTTLSLLINKNGSVCSHRMPSLSQELLKCGNNFSWRIQTVSLEYGHFIWPKTKNSIENTNLIQAPPSIAGSFSLGKELPNIQYLDIDVICWFSFSSVGK